MKHFVLTAALMLIPAVSYGAVTVLSGVTKTPTASVTRASPSSSVRTATAKKQGVSVNPSRSAGMAAVASTSSALKMPNIKVKGETGGSGYIPGGGGGVSTAEFDSFRESVEADIGNLWTAVDEAGNVDVSDKEDSGNKVTTISAASTDAQYPSAKAVWNIVQSLSDGGLAISGLGGNMVKIGGTGPGQATIADAGFSADSVAQWNTSGAGAGNRCVQVDPTGKLVPTGAECGSGAVSSVALASGTNNGTMKLTVDGAAADNIAVPGVVLITGDQTSIAGIKTFTGTVNVPSPALPPAP